MVFKIIKYLFLFISILIGLSIILLIFINYIPPNFHKGFLIGKEGYFYKGYNYFFYTHIFGGIIALLMGCILFMYPFQYKFPKLHRNIGKIYISSILIFSSLGGFVMSFFAKGGNISTLGFMLLAIIWFYFTLKAYLSAKKKNFEMHQIWITRSFLLTLAAPILRLQLFVNNHYGLWDVESFYILTAWISWLPQLLIYEIYLFRKYSNHI